MQKLPTYKIYLDARKASQTGEQPLILRIRFNRLKAEYSTGIKNPADRLECDKATNQGKAPRS